MIEAFYFDRGVKRAKPSELKSLRAKGKKVWVDMTDPKHEEMSLVKDIFSLHPITAEDILTHNARAKIEEFDTYLFVVLYGIYKHRNIRMKEIDFVLGKGFLITSHQKEIEGFQKLRQAEKKLDGLFRSGMDFLMHALIDSEVDNFIPVLELYDDVIDGIEDAIIESPDVRIMEKILDLRRRMNRIKKIIIPQQEKISFLARNKYELISPECQTYFRDVHDHFYTVTDMMEDYRDALSGSFDAYMSSVSNSTNEVMKVLSVIATIMLPLSVISGVYGMNFLFLPGAKDPFGFWAIIALMVLIIVLMLGFFNRKGWV